MMNFTEWLSENKRGTYVGLKFDSDSTMFLKSFMIENSIPNRVPSDKLHVTLLYSRKYLPDFKARGKIEPINIKPLEFNVWDSNGENDTKTKCLVLKFESKELKDLHNEYMDEYKATFDYPEYQPHVTLSYNIENYDARELTLPKRTLQLDYEYKELLNLNWASKL